MIPPMLLKFLLPKVLDHLLVVFKLDKVLDYVEKPNELDEKVEHLEDKIIALEKFADNHKKCVNCKACTEKIKEK
tara:strand:+ start:87 stop:311 length:225 start_codon:yes stop_codon:yes gene_type:complete